MRNTSYALLIFLILIAVFQLLYQQKTEINPNEISLREQNIVVDKIYSKEGDSNFCVKVYTPPIIPYTYDYLFTYHSYAKKINKPRQDSIGAKCWLILERDTCNFLPIEKKEKIDCENRIVNWKNSQIGSSSALLRQEKINNRLSLELWQMSK